MAEEKDAPMFVEVEGEQLINLGLCERIEVVHHKREARPFAGSMPICAPSHLLYQHFYPEGRGGEPNVPVAKPVPYKAKE